MLLLRSGEPAPVRGLVPEQQQPGLVAVLLAEPVQGEVGEDVGDVPGVLGAPVGADKLRVVVVALAIEHLPLVEPDRVVPRPVAEVPLAEQGGAVPGSLHQGGEGGLGRVEARGQRHHPVAVTVRPGEDCGPGGGAERVGAVGLVEPDALGGDPVQLRSLVDPAAVGAHRVRGMVVGVWLAARRRSGARRARCRRRARGDGVHGASARRRGRGAAVGIAVASGAVRRCGCCGTPTV